MGRKEALHLLRDPRSLQLAFALPAMMVLLFGYAITFDVRNIPLAVLDGDRTAESREVVDAFRATKTFVPTATITRVTEADALLARGRARLVLVVPPGFAADALAGRPARLQALVDGSDANTAAISLNYAQGVAASLMARRLAARASPGWGSLTPSAEIRNWYNEGLNSRLAIVPGLIAVVMMLIAALLTSLTIAREWERGTMEQLASIAVRPAEIVLGKLLPYLGIGLADVALTVILGVAVFRVPCRGSLLLLLISAIVFLAGALGLGLWISALLKSQVLATQVSMIVSYMPGLLLSGFFVDIPNLPRALQLISLAVPARYFIDITRGIFLKGIGIDFLWPQLLALVGFATAGLSLAMLTLSRSMRE